MSVSRGLFTHVNKKLTAADGLNEIITQKEIYQLLYIRFKCHLLDKHIMLLDTLQLIYS